MFTEFCKISYVCRYIPSFTKFCQVFVNYSLAPYIFYKNKKFCKCVRLPSSSFCILSSCRYIPPKNFVKLCNFINISSSPPDFLKVFAMISIHNPPKFCIFADISPPNIVKSLILQIYPPRRPPTRSAQITLLNTKFCRFLPTKF